MTGLANRRAFDERLAEVPETSAPDGALLVLDLDEFKSLNDAHGHPHGDEVLKQVAQLLRAGCRSHDCVARIGGEEFASACLGRGWRPSRGNWLTRDQANGFLNAADPKSLAGKRDGAIVALLIGCGLRRAELLRFDA